MRVVAATLVWLTCLIGAALAGSPCDQADQPGSITVALAASDGSTVRDADVWRAPGEVVTFTLQGSGLAQTGRRVLVCFALQGQPFAQAGAVVVERIEQGTDTLTYSAVIPPKLSRKARFIGAPRVGLVARAAEIKIIVSDTVGHVLTVATRGFGITSVGVSLFLAALSAALAYGFIWTVSRVLNVPGTGLLRIISTRQGVASLSQLQVMLWTLVIGTGAVYVMAISGQLMDIPDGALVLLGITGVVTGGAKLQNALTSKRTTAAPAPAILVTQAPAVVSGVQALIITDTEITLIWLAPDNGAGGPVRGYRLEYQPTAAPGWQPAADGVALPRYRVINLAPNTRYDFRVTAMNEFGAGPPALLNAVATQPFIGAQGAPAQVVGLSLKRAPRANDIEVAWGRVAAAHEYEVRARPHDGDAPWQSLGTTRGASMLFETADLPKALGYDVQVSARQNNIPGAWSQILVVTVPRRPEWADLVLEQVDTSEIDVTRVQMLFFTVIGAVFVGVKILATYTIPDIPAGFQLLMGITNGIYLTNKFIPDQMKRAAS
jgi:hypothetical protein